MGEKHSAAANSFDEDRMEGDWKVRGDEIPPWHFLICG